MTKENYTKWQLPAHIDNSGAKNLSNYIQRVHHIPENTHLILDLNQCRFFDFEGAKILLQIIATAKRKNISTTLLLSNQKLYQLLSLLQFNLLATLKKGEPLCHP